MKRILKRGEGGRIVSQGKGVGKANSVSIGSRYPANVAAALKALPNTQDFIRQAILEKMEREGIELEAISRGDKDAPKN